MSWVDYVIMTDSAYAISLLDGGKKLQLLNSDIQDWKITFVDTGLNSNIGQRFKAVEKYLESEEIFLVNYSDGLTDFFLPEAINNFYKQDKIASFQGQRKTPNGF